MTTSTATSALSKLEALEAAAFAGENVTPKQLTDARAAVDLEAMLAAGEQHRAEAAAAAEGEARRTAAKSDAATRVASVGTEAITAKFVAALDALDALVAAIDEHNATVVDAGRSLSAAGLPTDADVDAPHFDTDNHALTEHHQVVGATVAGVTYLRENAAKWVAPAVHDVALRNGKLALPYGRSLAKILEAGVSPGDRPTAVTAALIERQAANTA